MAQHVRGGDGAVAVPARVARDVPSHDRLAGERCRTHRAGMRPDRHAVQRLGEGGRQRRGGAVAQVQAVVLQQKDGRDQLPLEHPLEREDEGRQHVGERCPGHGQLERAGLAGHEAIERQSSPRHPGRPLQLRFAQVRHARGYARIGLNPDGP